MALSEIEKPQLKDLVYEHLKAAIVRLDLPPGRPLREADIATQMGMSKTPVREAFVRLASDGLVDINAYRGAVVRGYDATDLREIFELREVVEGFAACQAATGLTSSIRSLLEQNVKDSRLAVLVNDRAKLSYLVSEFDRIVYDQTKNSRVRQLIDQLRCHIDRIGNLSEHIPGRLAESVEQHTLIVEAILDADPDEAERLMRSHIRSVMEDQLQVLPGDGQGASSVAEAPDGEAPAAARRRRARRRRLPTARKPSAMEIPRATPVLTGDVCALRSNMRSPR